MKTGIWFLIFLILGTIAAGFLGSQFTPGQWYAELVKPGWIPAGWVFSVVWAGLYVMMAIAASLVWSRLGSPGAPRSLILYSVQVGLNAMWPVLFFGWHLIVPSFLELLLLGLVVLATTIAFWRISRPAGFLMTPYLAWIGFAAFLNSSIMRLNP